MLAQFAPLLTAYVTTGRMATSSRRDRKKRSPSDGAALLAGVTIIKEEKTDIYVGLAISDSVTISIITEALLRLILEIFTLI